MVYYCDTGDIEELKYYADDFNFKGFTTNPSLIAKSYPAGTNYTKIMQEILNVIPSDKTVSFEVVSDDPDEMRRQAKIISGLSPQQVYVKIPLLNPNGSDNIELVNDLLKENIKVNLTCVAFLTPLVKLNDSENLIISVFAGRIADTGVSPERVILNIKESFTKAKILWASMRELYNIKEAECAGCDIITIPTSFIKKFEWFNYTLYDVSRISSSQFLDDAKKAGLTL